MTINQIKFMLMEENDINYKNEMLRWIQHKMAELKVSINSKYAKKQEFDCNRECLERNPLSTES